MGENINLNNANEITPVSGEDALLEVTQGILVDARTTLDSKKSLSVPIAELATLGAGVSSLIPALNTITQTTTIAMDGLYTLANAGVGDVLKVAKNGNFWGHSRPQMVLRSLRNYRQRDRFLRLLRQLRLLTLPP